MHVLARTRAKPQVYYYRQRVDSLFWKAGWKKVEADIQGDFAFPCVWNRRLYIFWPEMTRKQNSSDIKVPAVGESIKGNPPYWEVKLAWVQLYGGRWGAKAISDELEWGKDPVWAEKFEYGRKKVLKKSPITPTTNPWRITVSSQDLHPVSQRPFFLQHDVKSFLIDPTYPAATGASMTTTSLSQTAIDVIKNGLLSSSVPKTLEGPVVKTWMSSSSLEKSSQIMYKFLLTYHPFIKDFISTFNRGGVEGLLRRETQPVGFGGPQNPPGFVATYDPDTTLVVKDARGQYAEEVVDFDYSAYAVYNWELFFHIPLMMAQRLSANQRFAEAQKWFHYIVNPTDTSTAPSPQRFWQTKKLFNIESSQYSRENVPAVFRFLAKRGNPGELGKLTQEELGILDDMEKSVMQWRRGLFQPYLIANTRPTAFQRAVVMKYIDNLIARGDQLFQANTLEKISEATPIYIMASDILGKRPVEVPARAIPEVQTYDSVESSLDSVSNALVRIEEFVPPPTTNVVPTAAGTPSPSPALMLYFCAPKNEN
ncbi:MAG: hypothetical protein Q9196_007329 [Gyalolechia fulgens]